MYLDQNKAIDDFVKALNNKILKSDKGTILCLRVSNKGEEMKLLLKIAEIIKSGKKEVFIIEEKLEKTDLDERGLLSLTVGFK